MPRSRSASSASAAAKPAGAAYPVSRCRFWWPPTAPAPRISAILPAVNADTIKDILAPVLGKDALLVTDGASFYPPCAATLGVTHETLNQSAGERVRGELHIQTVNSRHERLKTFLRRYRGIATKYLDSYLKWFHLAGLHLNPSPRTCLNAAMGRA